MQSKSSSERVGPAATGENSTPAGPEFTIFTATYNRAHTLPRLFASIRAQTFTDFEVVIVDDGSTDETRAVVAEFAATAPFPVIYHWQENSGRCAAHNIGVELARGRFFVLVDSDDMLLPKTLERFYYHWQNMPPEQRARCAGVEGLCQDMMGNLSGSLFPRDVMESNYLEIRFKLDMGGERKNCIRTEILRRFPYPIFSGEKHIRDSITWERIAQHYNFLYINEVVQLIEYQADGMTHNIYRVRMQNPQGFRFYYLENINERASYLSRRQLWDAYARYIRFSFHCGIGWRKQRDQVRVPWLWWLNLPKGFFKWHSDRWKMARTSWGKPLLLARGQG